MFPDQGVGYEYLACVAKPAHGYAGFVERGDNIAVFFGFAEMFECYHRIVFYLKDGNKTGGYRLVVHEHHA